MRFKVVVNHEEQYSIWPYGKEIPNGWEFVGFDGTKEECLDYIEQNWENILPLSVRKILEKENS